MKKTSLLILGLVLVFATAVIAQDPTVAAPDKYKMKFENNRVRVLEATIKTGKNIPMHSHPAHVAYVASAGKLKITDSEGKVTDADVKEGDVLWFDPVTHKAENVGTTDVKVVVVELKKITD